MKRLFLNTCLILIFAALLFICPVAFSASAETYSIGEDLTVYLSYGDLPVFYVNEISGTGKYYKIRSCVGAIEKGGEENSLLGADGRVAASPGRYYMSAFGNVDATDEAGNVLSGIDCSGTITFIVEGKKLDLTVSASDLSKTYGSVCSSLSWSFLRPEDEDSSLSVVLSSEGFLPTASVGSYEISAVSVTKGGDDVSDYYTVTVYEEGSSSLALFSVLKKTLAFTYAEEREVPFNDFYLSDGESVLSLTENGENGEIVTLFFRLTESASVLSVGSSYEIEPYFYEITPSAGDPSSYLLGDASNYAVSADLSSVSTIRAIVSSVTIYSDESKRAEREGDQRYVFISPEELTYAYLDAKVKDFSGSITFTGLSLYSGVTLDLTCSLSAGEGDLPCGTYPMSLESFYCSAVTSVSLEDLRLTVEKRVVGEYSETVACEYGSDADYEETVVYTFDGVEYSFLLSAPTVGLSVGSETAFSQMTSLTDDNVTLSYSSALVRIVKRSSGVSIVLFDLPKLYYGETFAPCALYLDYGEEGETVLPGTLSYSYVKNGESASRAGLPSQVGDFSVTCALSSDLYEAEERVFPLSIAKRPVAALYDVTKAKKPYGETFVFSPATVSLRSLYFYDETIGAENREKDGLAEGSALGSALGGTGITSAGGAKASPVGSYEIDFSGLTSPIYEVKKVILHDLSENEETSVFSVVKALAPAAVEVSVSFSGRAAIASAKGGETSLEGQISQKSNFASQTGASGNASVKFTALKYGVTYYVRLRVSDSVNYETAEGDWSEPVSFALAFPAPVCKKTASTSSSLTFSAERIQNAADYTVQHRVRRNGEWISDWTDGLEVTGLAANTPYEISFRAKNDASAGASSSLSVRTTRAAVDEKSVQLSYNKARGELIVQSELTLEYRLLGEDGEILSDWADGGDFDGLDKDGSYVLQVREPARSGAEASEILEIPVKEAPPAKGVGFLSDWFLVEISGVALVLLIVFIILFAKVKKSVDIKELGGKYDK